MNVPESQTNFSSPEERNYRRLKEFAQSEGAALFGVTNIESFKQEFFFPPSLTANLNRAVVVAVRLSEKILEEIEDHPTPLYYHHYRQINIFLDQLALRSANFIQERNWEVLPVPASQIIDWENQRGHLSHKKMAVKAGLGWIGRNNLLVNPQLGAQIRLVTILTNMPLKIDSPTLGDCGPCHACIPVCPAGAIGENPEEFDHLKCYQQLKLFRKLGYTQQFICGICVKACKGVSH